MSWDCKLDVFEIYKINILKYELNLQNQHVSDELVNMVIKEIKNSSTNL